MPGFHWPSNETEDSIALKYIDISRDSILMPILSEVIYENSRTYYSPKEKVNYFSLYLKEDNGFIDCHLTAHTKKRLSNSTSYTGYTMKGSIPVIITNRSEYHLELHPDITKRFPLDPPDLPPYKYDPMEWFYVINNNDYGKLMWGIGWIWNKPLDASIVTNENKFRLTRPKRAYKKRKKYIDENLLHNNFPYNSCVYSASDLICLYR